MVPSSRRCARHCCFPCLYHSLCPWTNGIDRLVGRTHFFVPSGFLITGGLYDNRNKPRRFRNFYIRRTLRIFPLFYFIWFCIFVAALFVHEHWHPLQMLWPLYLGNYARFLAGATAVDRIWTSHFAFEIGHFWSLAVEEQFYLLWPLVVYRVNNRQRLIRICIAVIFAVLLLRILLSLLLPHRILDLEFLYRMTFSQADGFLFGGLLALLMRGPKESALLRSGSRLFTGALAALLAVWLLHGGIHAGHLAPSTPWMEEYGFTLIDLAAGGLILCSLRPGNLLFLCMNFGPLRLLGRYSYGFYVYHVLLEPLLVVFVLKRWHIPYVLLYTVDFGIILGYLRSQLSPAGNAVFALERTLRYPSRQSRCYRLTGEGRRPSAAGHPYEAPAILLGTEKVS